MARSLYLTGRPPPSEINLKPPYRMGVTAERCTDGYEVQRKGLGRVARLGRFKEEETQVGVRWENLGGRRSRRSKRGGGRIRSGSNALLLCSHMCGALVTHRSLQDNLKALGRCGEHAVRTLGAKM